MSIKKTLTIISIVTFCFYSNVQANMGIGSYNPSSMVSKTTNMPYLMTDKNYDSFEVDLSQDVFTNPTSFMNFTNGMDFIDDNNDGVVDMVQNTNWFRSMDFGEWVDRNQDSIGDMFQSRGMYILMGMENYVDIDGDGLCDNYRLSPMIKTSQGMINLHEDGMVQYYEDFQTDIENDVFTNPEKFMEVSGGMEFADENDDGIVDIVQNTDWFQTINFGEWVDQNQDTIGDMFQTRNMYQLMGMDNFVDMDGDVLSDNYVK